MKTEIKEIYKCDFCNKLYQKKAACEAHEFICFKNPDNKRPCYGCIHLEKIKADLYFDTFQGEGCRKVDVFHCNAKDIYIHTPQVEAKGNAFEFGDKLNEPMPKQCDIYDSELKELNNLTTH